MKSNEKEWSINDDEEVEAEYRPSFTTEKRLEFQMDVRLDVHLNIKKALHYDRGETFEAEKASSGGVEKILVLEK